jgi:hypothetical protein
VNRTCGGLTRTRTLGSGSDPHVGGGDFELDGLARVGYVYPHPQQVASARGALWVGPIRR